jgi:uncharacterized lipoprotein NlpE involved in copper resistance
MKKVIFVIAACIISLASCKNKEEVTPDPTTATVTNLKSSITTGSWSVKVYREKLEDKTSIYSGYVFTFAADGSVSASNNGKVVKGSWANSEAGTSYYGAPPAAATFTITMDGSGSFSKINKSWDVNVKSVVTDIMLDNKEPLQDEHLEFIK